MADIERIKHPTNYQPLPLDRLGIKTEETSLYCEQARRWLGLELNPADVRKSRIIPDVTLFSDYDGQSLFAPEQYRLMARLYMATGLEAVIQSRLIDDQDRINKINISLNNTEPDLTDLHQFVHQLRNALVNSFIPNRHSFHDSAYWAKYFQRPDTDPQRLITMVTDTYGGNFHHDLPNQVIEFRAIENWLYLIDHSTVIEAKARQHILQLWDNGENIANAKYLLLGYQEELVPGWTEKKADVRKAMSSIIKSVGKRFNVVSDGTASIRAAIADNIGETVPVSEGAFHRIIYELVKNTAKAWGKQKEQDAEVPPLEINMAVGQIGEVLCFTMKDNGPGFDLNVPLKAIKTLLDNNPEFLDFIAGETSVEFANTLREYFQKKHPFAIYPITLEQLFRLLLARRITGSIVKETAPHEVTSGIGLSSLRMMLAESYGGEVMVTNHPDGGAFTLITFPLNKDAVPVNDIISQI